jgi:hypothetical protein
MSAVGVARASGAPWVGDGSGDRQGPFGLTIVAPHLTPIERPVGPVAKHRAGLEPFRPKTQRHHGEVHCRASHSLAAVLASHGHPVVAFDDPVVGPVEFVLLGFVRSEVVERAKERAGVERDDGKALFGKSCSQRASAGPGSNDGEIDRLVVAIFPHGHPTTRLEHVRRATPDGVD